MNALEGRVAASSGEHAELAALAQRRLQDLSSSSTVTTTLDTVIRRLFDRDHRELHTVSAFGAAL
jgi:hypothetical protein